MRTAPNTRTDEELIIAVTARVSAAISHTIRAERSRGEDIDPYEIACAALQVIAARPADDTLREYMTMIGWR